VTDKRQPEEADQNADDQELMEQIEYRPNTNQARHEPIPAGHDDERRPAAVERDEETAAESSK
jgi:hypothetical protein